MEIYNSVQKVDQNGEVYRGVAFNVPLIIKGKNKRSESAKISPTRMINEENKNEERAIRRAKMNIKDYIRTNADLNYFVTYTLDSKIIDRYDATAIYAKLRVWLSNRVARKGFKYILVPERHRDRAWHFHGFVNIPLEWGYGYSFSKAISSRTSSFSRNRCINYIVSYVKKDMEKFNGRYYLHSKNLDKPGKIYSNINFQDIKDCYCMDLEEVGVKVKIWG